MSRSRYITKEHKEYMSHYNCCELCGSYKKLELHHIVPIVCGGSDSLQNWIAICPSCHSKLTPKSELTRIGLSKTDKNCGRKKGQKVITKKSLTAKEAIRKLSYDFDGNMKDAELINALGIARNTFYKYKREMKSNDETYESNS